MSDTEAEPMGEWRPAQPGEPGERPSAPPAEPQIEPFGQVEPMVEPFGQVEPIEPPGEAQPVFDVPAAPQTGDPDVDTAIFAVAEAMSSPLEEQVAVYEAAHRTLQDRLADVEG